MNALVGYTGFVGSNLYMAGKFDAAYHSQNITDAYGTNPDLLVFAGLKGEKYLADDAPKKDMELILQAEDNLQKIHPKKLVLISTIDVFKKPEHVDEDTLIDAEGLSAYGYDRYMLECWVREHYPDALIVRLPGLFGPHLKKNFIYDFMNRIPFRLKADKMRELCARDQEIKNFYRLLDNGFYEAMQMKEREKNILKEKLQRLGFSALDFTDSRSVYQFYPLKRLWEDIQHVLEKDIRLWHPATEPVSAGEVYCYLTGETFVNKLEGKPASYDCRTVYDSMFGGKNGYICSKETVLEEIKRFVRQKEG